MNKKTIILVDDHIAICMGLRSILNNSGYFMVKKHFSSSKILLQYLKENYVDIVISDISIPDENVLITLKSIKEIFKEIKIVIYSMHDSEGFFREAMQSRIDGYILKSDNMDDISWKIQEISEGRFYCSSSLKEYITGNSFLFSEKEHTILGLFHQGYSNEKISEVIGRSLRTVEYHITNIKDKLDIKNSYELLQFCQKVYFK